MADQGWDPTWAVRAEEVLWAVAAHRMLDSTTVIVAAGRLLSEKFEEIAAGDRRELIEGIIRHGDRLATVLGELVRGLPPSALNAADANVNSRRLPLHFLRSIRQDQD
jgi:hypothetical protein